jgi:nucleoside-diphosphate-sugar epimerase
VRIFIAGASGVLGRALLPLLVGHDVVGTTRSRPDVVRTLGAEPIVLDAFDRGRVHEAVQAARPEVVVDLLTDLQGRDFAANDRIRREATPILVEAAVAARVPRLVIESIAFDVAAEAAAARDAMERTALESGLDVAIVRLGRLWGPGTWSSVPGDDGSWESVERAAARLRDATLRLGSLPGGSAPVRRRPGRA